MSKTPLSDYITKLIEAAPDNLVAEFYDTFLASEVGLILNNMPEAEAGSKFTVSGNNITSSLVSDPNGNQLVKVCADPDVFEGKYNAGINALMTGDKVIEMLLKMDGPKGLLVCSAASFHSYPVYLETAEKLALSSKKINSTKRWWKFWR